MDFAKDPFYIAMAGDNAAVSLKSDDVTDGKIMIFTSRCLIPPLMEKFGILTYTIETIQDCPDFIDKMHRLCRDVIIDLEIDGTGRMQGAILKWQAQLMD